MAVTPLVAFAACTTFDDTALDLATMMFFLSPLGLGCLVFVSVLAALQPRTVAMGAAELVVWCSLVATLFVTGLIANAGVEQWCLD